LLLIPALNLKATLAQTTQNQPSSSLIILKKSPVIIVTGNNHFPDVRKMVLNRMTGDLTRGLGLGNHGLKILPFVVA
jgi:hypothetical protein